MKFLRIVSIAYFLITVAAHAAVYSNLVFSGYTSTCVSVGYDDVVVDCNFYTNFGTCVSLPIRVGGITGIPRFVRCVFEGNTGPLFSSQEYANTVQLEDCLVRNNATGLVLRSSVILNSLIENNGGDGLVMPSGNYFYSPYADLSNVVIRGNAGNGCSFLESSHATLIDCMVISNSGAGIQSFMMPFYLGSAFGQYTRCTVVANSDGGLQITGDNLFDSCIVSGNSTTNGRGGGAVCWLEGDSYPGKLSYFKNCLLENNSAPNGGAIAIHSYYCDLLVEHCTVRGHQAGTGGFISLDYGTRARILNSAIWENTTDPVYLPYPLNSSLSFTNSDAEFGEGQPWFGDGCIDTDPLFVSAEDSRLATGSPCIDAVGSTNFPPVDIAGFPRPLDGDNDGIAAADMGAYEFLSDVADTDGDHVSDSQEVAGGTRPVDGNSYFGLESIQFLEDETLVTWKTVYGHGYRVQRAQDMNCECWSNIAPADIFEWDENPEGTESFLDSGSTTSSIYRIKHE